MADGRRITFGVLAVLVAAFPWDDALGYPTETISIPKLLGLALGAAYVITMAGRTPVVLAPTLAPVAAFLGLVVLSLLASGELGTGRSQVLRYVLFAGLFLLVTQIVTHREQVGVLAAVLVASSAVAAGVGLLRFLAGTADRASGPIGDANDFAYLLGTALPLGLLLVVQGGRRSRWLWAAASIVITVAILGTLSRGALVGLVVMAAWAAVRGRVSGRAVLAAVVVLAVVAGAAVAFQRPFVEDRLRAKSLVAEDNIESRQALWRGALEMSADHPVLGVGPGMYPERADEYVVDEPYGIVEPVAHNAFLEILAEDGVPALLAFVAFVAGTWVLLRRAHRRAVEDQDRATEQVVTALQAAHIMAVAGACFLSVQATPPIWFVGALAVAVVDRSPDRVVEPVSSPS